MNGKKKFGIKLWIKKVIRWMQSGKRKPTSPKESVVLQDPEENHNCSAETKTSKQLPVIQEGTTAPFEVHQNEPQEIVCSMLASGEKAGKIETADTSVLCVCEEAERQHQEEQEPVSENCTVEECEPSQDEECIPDAEVSDTDGERIASATEIDEIPIERDTEEKKSEINICSDQHQVEIGDNENAAEPELELPNEEKLISAALDEDNTPENIMDALDPILDQNDSALEDDKEEKVIEQNSTSEQLPSVTDTKQDAIPVGHRRWEQLHEMPCCEWSVRRVCALGADCGYLEEQAEVSTLGELSNDTIPAWVDRLDEAAWAQALLMCEEWEKLLREHRDAFRVLQMQKFNYSFEQIRKQLQLSAAEVEGKTKALQRAIGQWFDKHAAVLKFIYSDDAFHEKEAGFFFGKTTASFVKNLLDNEISQQTGSRKTLAKGVQTEEAESQRTYVMTRWDQLRRYLLDQFRQQPLLGSIELTDEEFELLMSEFRVKYHAFLLSDAVEKYTDEIISIALVQIALRDYRNNALWPYVAKRLGQAKVNQNLMKLGAVFIRTMKVYGKACFDGGEYVASILMHCFACDSCIPKLFDFLYVYYSIDISRDMSQADVGALCQLMGSGDYYPRKHMIYQHTQDALRAFGEIGCRRLKAYLTWIDGAFWNRHYVPEGSGRFKEQFLQWRSKHPDFDGSYGADRAYGSGVRRFTHPELQLDMRTGSMKLYFPRQQLPLRNGDNAVWHVAGDLIPAVVCELTEGATCLHTQETTVSFPMEHLLSTISCRLEFDGEVVRTFTIAEDCLRAFDERGMQLPTHHLKPGMNYCFVSPDAPLQLQHKVNSHRVGPWLMMHCVLKDGDVISYPDGTASIVGYDLREGLCGVAPLEHAYVMNNSEERFDVYPHMPMLFLRTQPERFDSGRLLINEQYYRLNELPFKQTELHDRSGEKGFLITLPKLHQEQGGLYRLKCDIAGEQDVRLWSFACLDNFAYRFESNEGVLPYWDVPRGSVTVTYDEPLSGEHLVKHPRKNEFGFDIDAALQEICLKPVSDAFRLYIRVPMVAWRMDEQEWSTKSVTEIWLSDLGKQLEFITQEHSITLMVDQDAEENGRVAIYSRSQHAECIRCDLAQLRTWLTRDRIKHEIYVGIGKEKFLLANVYCSSYLASARLEADYEAGGISGVFEILGKGKYAVSIVYKEQTLAEYVPIENGQVFLPLPMESGLYQATIYEVENDEFGFGEQLYPLGQAQCQLIDPENLSGRRFYLSHLVTLNMRYEKLELAHKRYWIDLHDRDEQNKTQYRGTMRITSSLGEHYLIHVVVVIPDRSNINRCQLLFMEDGEEQSFLYDYVTKKIVTKELDQLHYMERYRRYSLLDPEDLFQIIYL